MGREPNGRLRRRGFPHGGAACTAAPRCLFLERKSTQCLRALCSRTRGSCTTLLQNAIPWQHLCARSVQCSSATPASLQATTRIRAPRSRRCAPRAARASAPAHASGGRWDRRVWLVRYGVTHGGLRRHTSYPNFRTARAPWCAPWQASMPMPQGLALPHRAAVAGASVVCGLPRSPVHRHQAVAPRFWREPSQGRPGAGLDTCSGREAPSFPRRASRLHDEG
jgi:hypothetical protein